MSEMRMLLFLAVAPAVFLVYLVYKKDTYDKEPIRLLLYTGGVGAVTVIPAAIFEIIGEKMVGFIQDEMFRNFIIYFFTVALVEEVLKFSAVYLMVWKNEEFNYRFDGIVYAVAASSGFAIIENICYVFTSANPFSIAIMRAILSVPGHIAYGIMMGLFLGRAKYSKGLGDEKDKRLNLFFAILVPMMFHGLFDFLVTQTQMDSSLFGVVILESIAEDVIAIIIVLRASKNDLHIVGTKSALFDRMSYIDASPMYGEMPYGGRPQMQVGMPYGAGPQMQVGMSYGMRTQMHGGMPYGAGPQMHGGMPYGAGPQMHGGMPYGAGPQMHGGMPYGAGPQMQGGMPYGARPQMQGGMPYGAEPQMQSRMPNGVRPQMQSGMPNGVRPQMQSGMSNGMMQNAKENTSQKRVVYGNDFFNDDKTVCLDRNDKKMNMSTEETVMLNKPVQMDNMFSMQFPTNMSEERTVELNRSGLSFEEEKTVELSRSGLSFEEEKTVELSRSGLSFEDEGTVELSRSGLSFENEGTVQLNTYNSMSDDRTIDVNNVN